MIFLLALLHQARGVIPAQLPRDGAPFPGVLPTHSDQTNQHTQSPQPPNRIILQPLPVCQKPLPLVYIRVFQKYGVMNRESAYGKYYRQNHTPKDIPYADACVNRGQIVAGKEHGKASDVPSTEHRYAANPTPRKEANNW